MHVLFADCDLDTEARRFLRAGDEIHLSPKAFELLKTLVDSRPRALSKQELLDRIWPGTFVSDASLARAVSEIREALGEHSRTDGFLQTVHGFGYRFTEAGVTVVPGPAAGAARRAEASGAGWSGRTRSSSSATATTPSAANPAWRCSSTRRGCRASTPSW